ncbi:unnamed protein product [Peronospora belbahrii]|uniref:Uncharacterized protein n=1 Tax=Peronospora belbahrii TaxID=622444 RepID=A0AAU9KST3_9STRA|nr:unnamed protein product [Peronospora belbahrii]
MWLYLDRVKEGYAKKLVHLWHGPFRVLELVGEYAARLETRGTEYRLFPVVHLPKIEMVRDFPTERNVETTKHRVNFDEYLLPEDSCEESLRKVKEVLEAPLKRRRNIRDSNRSSLLVGKGMQIPLDGWGRFELWSLTPGL